VLADATALATSPSTPTTVALEAGFHALACADACGAFDRMESVFRHLERKPISSDEAAALAHLIRVVYHSACGDPGIALESAMALVELRHRMNSPAPVRLRAKFALGSALHRAGHAEEAIAFARDCVRTAESTGLPHFSILPLTQVANWSLAHDQPHEAELALRQAFDAINRTGVDALLAEVRYSSAKLALARDDLASARNHLAMFAPGLFSDTAIRRRVNVQAASIELQLKEGILDTASRLFVEFATTFDHCASHGNLDYAASVYVRALGRLRGTDAASEVLDRFIRIQRRELGALPAILARLQEARGVDR